MNKNQLLPRKATAHLKAASLIIGVCFWLILSNIHTNDMHITIPVCFDNMSTTRTLINAPETVTVTLRSKRKTLRTLDTKHLALHVDATKLPAGKHLICATPSALLLPDSIAIVEKKPVQLYVELA